MLPGPGPQTPKLSSKLTPSGWGHTAATGAQGRHPDGELAAASPLHRRGPPPFGEGSSLRGAGLVRTLHQLCLFPCPRTPPPWADPARSTPEPACPPTAHTAQATPAWTKLTRPTCDSAAQPARTQPHAAPWPPRSQPAPLTTRRPPGWVPVPTASGLPRTRPAACTSRRVSPGPRTLAAGRPL